MLKAIDNASGVFQRELLKDFQEYRLFFSDFESVKEWIDDWGLLYQGEKRFDRRQILDYSRKRKISDFNKAERILLRQSRIAMRSDVYWQLENRKVKEMALNVQKVAEILYRLKLCEVAI